MEVAVTVGGYLMVSLMPLRARQVSLSECTGTCRGSQHSTPGARWPWSPCADQAHGI